MLEDLLNRVVEPVFEDLMNTNDKVLLFFMMAGVFTALLWLLWNMAKRI